MRVVRVTLQRTISQARGLFSSAVAICCFLVAGAVLFSFNLEAAEGSVTSVIAIWVVSITPILPVLAAVLGMDVWSEEYRSGRITELLSVAIRERDLVLGKFLGVFSVLSIAAILSLLMTLISLWFMAPGFLKGLNPLAVLPALLGILLQGALWCSVSVAMSALLKSGSSAACASILLCVGLPRGLWAGLMAWSGKGRLAFGNMPLDVQAVDMAVGMLSLNMVAACLVVSVTMLFIASKGVAAIRFVGKGSVGAKISTVVAVVLSLIATGLFVILASRLDFTLELPISGVSSELSARTRGILSESSGDIALTCLLPRSDPRFRATDRLMRRLKKESEAIGGARFVLRYVDPNWDIGATERLIEQGVVENGLVFEKGRRMISLPIKDGDSERACASAIRRLTVVPRHRNVYWTIGHGESRFDDYGTFGMSDIARELSREGYLNQKLDLAMSQQIPNDCALIVVAGAKNTFSRVELARLDAYLHEGGRILVLLGSSHDEVGVATLLPSWGIRLGQVLASPQATLSGTDVIVSGFSDHPIAAPLKGLRIVLEKPVLLVPSATAETGGLGVDSLEYSPLASVGTASCAVAVERGARAGTDLAIRPMRVVAIGDVSFVLNGALASRANANRDFFLNCVSYLAGTDIAGGDGSDADLLITGFDRADRFRHALYTAFVFPGLIFLILTAEVLRRGRRT